VIQKETRNDPGEAGNLVQPRTRYCLYRELEEGGKEAEEKKKRIIEEREETNF
jgi:hypothetical protein